MLRLCQFAGTKKFVDARHNILYLYSRIYRSTNAWNWKASPITKGSLYCVYQENRLSIYNIAPRRNFRATTQNVTCCIEAKPRKTLKFRAQPANMIFASKRLVCVEKKRVQSQINDDIVFRLCADMSLLQLQSLVYGVYLPVSVCTIRRFGLVFLV